jgi:hypothetical protein
MVDRLACFAMMFSLVSVSLFEGTGDAADTAEVRAESATATDVAKLIVDLENGNFKARRLATEKLVATGKAAIEPVTKAATGADLETATRCIDILKALQQSKDAATKKEAVEALTKLSKSENRSVAQRAAAAIAKPKPVVPGINPFGANIRIQVRAVRPVAVQPQLVREVNVNENGKKIHIKETIGWEIVVKVTEKVAGKEKTTETKAKNAADLKKQNLAVYELYRKHIRKAQPRIAQAIQIQAQNFNGKREVNVVEKGRKIQITDTNKKDIVVRVTETVGGKEKTTESKAKGVAELKKKHPEAAKLFEKYANQQNNVIQLFAGPGGIQIQGVPQVIPIRGNPFAPRQAAPNAKAANTEIDKAKAQLDKAVARLKTLAGNKNVKPEDLRKLAEELQSARKQLDEAQKKLTP